MRRSDLHDAVCRELQQWTTLSPRDQDRFASDLADRLRLDGEVSRPQFGFTPKVYDLRSEQDYDYPRGKKKARIRRGMPVMRDVSKIRGIVFHQTAVEYGVSRHQVAASGGDAELALARRGLDVACHMIAFRAGIFVATHPFRAWLNHGNGFNRTSLGFEIDGRYSGLKDDPTTTAREDLKTTWKGNPTEYVKKTSETVKSMIRWALAEAAKEGIVITKFWAHRQSSATRRSDPGEDIWDDIAPFCRSLGLVDEPELVMGDGAPIPDDWDGGSGKY